MSQVSKNRIGFIGRVDFGRTLYDGQTVKTRMMYRLLCEMYGGNSILVVDTFDYRHRAPRVVYDFIRCILFCDDVFVLLSENGRRAFFPLLAFVAKYRGVRVYHNLIGGWLARNLEKYPRWVDYLNNFEVNWVESAKLAASLADKGVGNARYLPNFKYLDTNSIPEKDHVGPDYCFCTFSRVTEKKGVGDAIHAIENVARQYGAGSVSLDIFGPVEDGYREEFEFLLDRSPHARYYGCVAPEESVAAIAKYDALLFPTKWEPEGIPGTIIDALAAGVPVIASRWGYYDEMLEDGVTGLSYEFGRQEQLAACIESFIDLGEEARRLRLECAARANTYSPENVAQTIDKAMQSARTRGGSC